MEANEPMELSIVIVNWNSKDYLQKCIASILDSKSNIQYEIVVIDGGSFDGAGEILKQCYPEGSSSRGTKTYRRACWDALGGLITRPDRDTVDELNANFWGGHPIVSLS